MDTHNIDICPIEWYGYALKSVRDISRICEEEMRESNHMRDITHLYPNRDTLTEMTWWEGLFGSSWWTTAQGTTTTGPGPSCLPIAC